MEPQLFLIPDLHDESHDPATGADEAGRPVAAPWRLDERTRSLGREGVQRARAALRSAA